jgi:esterase/lipase superfamily enzyme
MNDGHDAVGDHVRSVSVIVCTDQENDDLKRNKQIAKAQKKINKDLHVWVCAADVFHPSSRCQLLSSISKNPSRHGIK